MERVQFQQEEMLAELKDLVQKGLFTEKEIKQIMKKRTAFETTLVRRVAKKGDYLRYVTYEMGLEALRRKRAERLKLPPGPPSVSDYALVRRQFHIFERALKKFKSDVALWIQYIQVAKKEGARSLVGRITARALQLHSNVPALYILAASHELGHLSPSAARTLLQRGIRLNSESVEMWREYVKMELGFVEGLRRRWGVLGIDVPGVDKGKGKESAIGGEAVDDAEREKMAVDAEEEGDDGEAARKEIMQGAIAKSVISSAAKALPKPELFVSLHNLISSYPCPPALRISLLDHLHTLLKETLPLNAQAVELTATRFLTPDLEGTELVDRLKEANEGLTDSIKAVCAGGDGKALRKNGDREAMGEVYARFVDGWCRKDSLDPSLKAYLISSLHSLIQHNSSTPIASLMSTHITLVTNLSSSSSSSTTYQSLLPSLPKILKLACRYTETEQVRSNAKLWIARLNAETVFGLSTKEKVGSIWREARENVSGEGVIDVWTWGMGDVGDQTAVDVLETLLNESMRMQDTPSWNTIHENLLLCYTDLSISLASSKSTKNTNVFADLDSTLLQTTPPTTTHAFSDANVNVKKCQEFIRRLDRSYLPTETVWAHVFSLLSSPSIHPPSSTDHPHILKQVYQRWYTKDPVQSTISWARWLLKNGMGRESVEVLARVRGGGGEEGVKGEVERAWKLVLDGLNDENDGGEGTGEGKDLEGDVMMDVAVGDARRS